MKKTIIAGTAFSLLLPFAVIAQAGDPNAGIEALVRSAFADAPDMIAVAKCESGFRQFTASGSVLRGGAGGGYLGIFQIGEQLHTPAAAALGFDILTINGNIDYARHLYGRSGITPWRECAPLAASLLPPPALTADLKFGVRHPQARIVQQLLNAKGFAVAASGPGSPGSETEFFGHLTRDAVRRFQCQMKIVCEGTETTTGYGRVGPRTRAALSSQ